MSADSVGKDQAPRVWLHHWPTTYGRSARRLAAASPRSPPSVLQSIVRRSGAAQGCRVNQKIRSSIRSRPCRSLGLDEFGLPPLVTRPRRWAPGDCPCATPRPSRGSDPPRSIPRADGRSGRRVPFRPGCKSGGIGAGKVSAAVDQVEQRQLAGQGHPGQDGIVTEGQPGLGVDMVEQRPGHRQRQLADRRVQLVRRTAPRRERARVGNPVRRPGRGGRPGAPARPRSRDSSTRRSGDRAGPEMPVSRC